MAKKEFTSVQIFIILIGICVVSSAVLAWVYNVTKNPIAEVEAKKKQDALRSVLPAGTEKIEVRQFKYKGKDVEIQVGFDKNGAITGYAFESETDKGYGGTILFLIGVNAIGEINAFVADQKETPGLGSNITSEKFGSQFKGKGLHNFRFKVMKDGGDVQAITAATISSRAACDAFQKGLEMFEEFKKSHK